MWIEDIFGISNNFWQKAWNVRIFEYIKNNKKKILFVRYKGLYMKIVYIDAQNIHKGTKDLWWTIDRELFFLYMHKKFDVDEIKIFLWYIKNLASFYKKLQDIWYKIVFKQTMIREDWTIKWNVDVDLTMSVMDDLHTWLLSSTYIVSWDGDFNTLIQRLVEEKKLWRLIVPTIDKTSSQLRRASGSNIQALLDLKHLLSKKRDN